MSTSNLVDSYEEYSNKLVLFKSKYCKYCAYVSKMLENYDHLIVKHDVDEQGYPDFMPALPELVAFDEQGNRLESICGLKSAKVYTDFLKQHLL